MFAGLRKAVRSLWDFVAYCFETDVIGIAAKTAFFFLLALFPLCMLAGWALSYFQLDLRVLEGFLPSHMLDVLPSIDEAPAANPASNPVLYITTLWAASNAVWALMKGVGMRVEGFWASLRARAMALLFTFCFLGIIALTLAFLAVSRWLNLLLVAAALSLLLFALYRYTPGTNIRTRRAVWTALCGSIIWLVVSRGFEIYMRYFSNYEALYGSFGIFLGLALWVLFVSLVIITGAKTASWKAKHSSGSAEPKQRR